MTDGQLWGKDKWVKDKLISAKKIMSFGVDTGVINDAHNGPSYKALAMRF